MERTLPTPVRNIRKDTPPSATGTVIEQGEGREQVWSKLTFD